MKILYLEDEPFLAKIVKESLESRGFEVFLVGDGALGLKAFEQFKPDICVLDVMLPHKDGFEVGSQIKQANDRMPILYLTAKVQTEDVIKGFQSGGNDYLRKPFSMEELIIRLQNLIQLSTQKPILQPAQNTGVSIGQYVFFPQKYELAFKDQTRKLSFKESELLKILSESRNNVINRKNILLKIWNDDSFFNSRNLDVYITKLREYLREDPNVQIVTIKGVGYNFVVLG
jgi:two-component system, OmpR family, response regulator VicR